MSRRRYTPETHRRAVQQTARALATEDRPTLDLRVLEAMVPENHGTARERRSTIAARLTLADRLRRSIGRGAIMDRPTP